MSRRDWDEDDVLPVDAVWELVEHHPYATDVLDVWEECGRVSPGEVSRILGISPEDVSSAIGVIRWHSRKVGRR